MPFKDLERRREYQRQWVANRRAEYFADKCCVICGATEDLHLDHIDPDTKVDHRIFSWSRKRMEAELAKCQVLCRKHHEEKSSLEISGHLPYEHGTKSMYSKHGCRCEDCLQWRKNRYQRYG